MANYRGKPGTPTLFKKQHAGTKLTKETAKRKLAEHVKNGSSIAAALEKIGRTRSTYDLWRKEDREFAAEIDLAREIAKGGSNTDRKERRDEAWKMGFASFRRKYLNRETWPHQQQWVDVLEGREPSNLHPSQTWTAGTNKKRVVVNCPPEHSKSTTITFDYVVYRICCNPAIRIKVISKTTGMARQYLYAIKLRLTHPDYADLIRDFAPEGGFEASAEAWGADQIRLARGDGSATEKDPTVEALGIGSHVQGARAELIICDDVEDMGNAGSWEAHRQYIVQDLLSRVGVIGTVLVIGTRVGTRDIFSALLDKDYYSFGKVPWYHLSQPAVLEKDEDPKNWVTLWPKAEAAWEGVGCGCDDPACSEEGYGDGTFPHFDGPHLNVKFEENGPREWNLLYQQTALAEDLPFPTHAIAKATNNRRRPGVAGGLDRIPDNAFFIGGLDPATSGGIGFVVYAIDRTTKKRYVADAKFYPHGATPHALKEQIKLYSQDYPIKIWAIEKTGLNTYFTQDRELNDWLRNRGIILREHYTTGYGSTGKWDAAFGIASMAPLFGTYERRGDELVCLQEPILELPRQEVGIRPLVEQLSIWTTETDPKRTACDMVMALWFCEIQARKLVENEQAKTREGSYRNNSWISKRALIARKVIDLNDLYDPEKERE